MTRFLTGGLAVFSIRLIGATLQLVLVALAVWLFPVRDVGLNGILWTCAVIARGVGPLGMDVYVLREMPRIWQSGDRARFFAVCRGSTIALCGVLALPVIGLASGLAYFALSGPLAWSLALAIPVVILCSALQRLWSNYIRAQGRVVLSQCAEAVLVPSLAVGALLISAAWAPETLFVGQALATVLGAALIWFWLAPRRDLSVRFRLSIEAWRDIVPLGMGTGFSIMAARLPILFVGAHSAVQAAHFDIGQRVYSAATLASQSASAVFLPRVQQLANSKHARQLKRELVSATAMGVTPALFILVALGLLGAERTENLLGKEYEGTWLVAILLTSAAAVNAGTGICHGVLAMTGRTRAFLVIAVIQCTLVLGFGWLFFTGSAVDMAAFMLAAEAFRGVLLLVLTVLVFRSLSPGKPKHSRSQNSTERIPTR